MKAELKRSRNKGYAGDNEEYVAGVRCVASSILNQQGVPVAMLGVSGPKGRVSPKNRDAYGKLLGEFALEISRKLGYKTRE